METRDVLGAVYDALTKGDPLSLAALADIFEENEEYQKANDIRSGKIKVVDGLQYTVPTGEGDFVVNIHMKELVGLMVTRALRTRSRISNLQDGIVNAQPRRRIHYAAKVRNTRQIKNQIPMSELQDAETRKRD